MLNAIKQKVVVQPGGKIEIYAPELPAGTTAEVILILNSPIQNHKKSLTSLLGAGKGSFATPEEADNFIREIRGE